MSDANDTTLDDLDRELLNALQWDFPVDAQPYAALADRLGTTEDEVHARIRRVKDAGILRQLSAIFDPRALGYGSSLVAAKIDPDRIDDAAAVISEHPGVSHNYKRNHAYNLWYTIAVPPGDSLDDHIKVLHQASGALVTRKLPTLKLYKIGVKLDMTGQTPADARVEVLEHERPERREHMDAPELSELEVAAIRISQEDLPLVERPFAAEAEQIGTDEETSRPGAAISILPLWVNEDRRRSLSSDATDMIVGEFAGLPVGLGAELPAAAIIRQPLFSAA